MLRGDVLVVHRLRFLLRLVEHLLHVRADAHLHGGAVDLGLALQFRLHLLQQQLRAQPQRLHDLRHYAIGLLQQRQQKMLRLDLAVIVAPGLFLGLENRLLCLLCELVQSHDASPGA